MPVFVYQGKQTRTGADVSGEIEGTTRENVVGTLRRQGIIVLNLREKPKELKLPTLGGIKKKEVVVFTRQFATMVNAGLPLVQCLEVLGNQAESKRFGEIVGEIRVAVEGGSTLANALAKHPKVFDEFYIHMVEAGEAGGILDVILNRLASYMEKAEALKGKVRGAMIYPAVVTTIAVGITTLILTVVVPTFKTMFEDFGAELPAPTKILLNFSELTVKYFPFVTAFVILSLIGFIYYKKTPQGGLVVDRFVLKLPIFGGLLRKVAVAKFTRTLGTLIGSGVSILDALNITAKTAGNKEIERAVLFSQSQIQEGKTLAEPLIQTAVFPPMVTSMINVGEEAGALDEMLTKIADFYDQEVDTAVGALTSLIEPLLILFLGVVIGAVVIALFLPILTISAQIR
jgi:type IV pilus assembly protein PilC